MKVHADGLTFDSKREYARWKELQLLERAGEITQLERQVPFELLPAQYIEIFDKKKRKMKPVCVEKSVKYVADFTYRTKDGEWVVEDSKGMKTKDYILKRKLMLYLLKIRVHEV